MTATSHEGTMTRRPVIEALVLAVVLGLGSVYARAQSGAAMLSDDIIILSQGQRAQEKARTETPLGNIPGTGYNPFRFQPAAEESIVEQRPRFFGPALPIQRRRRDVLSSITAQRAPRFPQARPPQAPVPPVMAAPIVDVIELPRGDYEGPENGLTLDQAVDRLVRENHDLRSKFYEIPQADADVLSAGLRANPIVFGSGDSVPYGSYSPTRPGANDYTVVVVQPIDANGKIRKRKIAARRAKNVIEAQYQDAVRLEIGNLYSAFVDVLAEREAVRAAETAVKGMNSLLATTEGLFKRGVQPHSEVDRIAIQHETAMLQRDEAVKALRQANQVLGYLLNLPGEEADRLEVRGRVREEAVEPPTLDALLQIARESRPDLSAFHLGIHLAEANVAVERSSRFEDVFLLYTPYTFTNNAPINQNSTTSWSLGGMMSIPLFNRNQGNIARAKLNVEQSRLELSRLERQVAAEVRRAWLEYDTTRAAVHRIEREILPRAVHLHEDKLRLFTQGEEDAVSYLGARREFNDVVRQYRDSLIRHRRSTLRLNTVVGRRVMP
jgi:cobalt-zinc-cadmium efflux system outer membrane protein